jgi:putative ATP-dependent endonuclease of the OLD family
MKIESVSIENFRGFNDQNIRLGDYTCLVGRNGSGKSTVLYALNVFFRQFKDTATDLSRLCADDFHHKHTDAPIRITVTFCDLNNAAKLDLADYVRQDKLIVTAEAIYDADTQRANVRQYGSRLGMEAFRKYFDAEKAGAKASELKNILSSLRKEFPGIAPASTKVDMEKALNDYESNHPEDCVLLKSEDQFYGVTRGSNRLDPHIQWVFVAATKDYSDEATESKDSALGQLLARTVRSKTDFTIKISELKQRMELEYGQMLSAEQHTLQELSTSLEKRLRSWAHPLVTAQVTWNADPEKSVRINEPMATVRLGERGFSGELPRFGHGLQRSYLLTLLQELTSLGTGAQPTLIMGIEEPELYQHPPQARHLAEVLRTLSSSDAQVVCCSHSPLFIPGVDVEAVRMVRDVGSPCQSTVTSVMYSNIALRLEAAGDKLLKEQGMLAKLYTNLNPAVNEMFFCSHLILVEGIEDIAHLMTYLELMGLNTKFREYGCHIVPVGGKSELLRPLAVALELGIPTYVVWDADTDKTKESEVVRHKRENRAIQSLLGVKVPQEWPGSHMQGTGYCMWQVNLTNCVQTALGEAWRSAQEKAEIRYGQPGGLQKNPVAIAYAHECAWNEGRQCSELKALVEDIIAWASV